MSVIQGRDLGEVKRETINELFWATVERYPEVLADRKSVV